MSDERGRLADDDEDDLDDDLVDDDDLDDDDDDDDLVEDDEDLVEDDDDEDDEDLVEDDEDDEDDDLVEDDEDDDDDEDEDLGDVDHEDDDEDEDDVAATAADVLEYLVKALVGEPDAVDLDVEERRGVVSLRVRVGRDDMGRVIGKRGRTANAIRTVVRAAAVQDDVAVDVDFVD